MRRTYVVPDFEPRDGELDDGQRVKALLVALAAHEAWGYIRESRGFLGSLRNGTIDQPDTWTANARSKVSGGVRTVPSVNFAGGTRSPTAAGRFTAISSAGTVPTTSSLNGGNA
ncbi:hypothetical protein GCM10009747_18420 [Agromyces humatus]|uniref:Uncharacterized protein n=1 Tax=Agromyces humatus TaxID=279573 RepID=A0ABP4WTL9_9MICO